MRIIHLKSTDELLRVADQWNDLWFNSDVTDPTGRAELIPLWVKRFAPQQHFHALIVEESGRFLAAMPLVENRVRGVLKVGTVPANAWAHGGGMLLRLSSNVAQAVDLLANSLTVLPWQLIWLECIRISSAAYRLLQESLSARAVRCSITPQYAIAIISTSDRSWDEYWETLGPSLRSNLRQQTRRFGNLPEARFYRFSGGTLEEIYSLIEQLFQVEDRSWKGAASSSVIKRGMLSFYQQQAVELAKSGCLAVFSLQVGGRPIAFEYGYLAKNVYHACKSGYDPELRQLSPGQLLRYHILQELFADPNCTAYDCIGEYTDTLEVWQPDRTCQAGQFLISTSGFMSRSVLHFKQRYWPALRRLTCAMSNQIAANRGKRRCEPSR